MVCPSEQPPHPYTQTLAKKLKRFLINNRKTVTMTLLKIHTCTPYASRAGEFYRRQREKREFKHVCPHAGCDAKFYVKCQLTQHMLKHTGEKPFACAHCDYAAKQKALLDKHNLREHGIPLPSTRASRHRLRTSLPPQYTFKRVTRYTGKVPTQRRERLDQRITLYKNNNSNILSLVECKAILKKEFYADKSAGYIYDTWVLYDITDPARVVAMGNSERKAEKAASIMNQIHNLHILFPDQEEFLRELQSLKNDNARSQEQVEHTFNLYQTNFMRTTNNRT